RDRPARGAPSRRSGTPRPPSGGASSCGPPRGTRRPCEPPTHTLRGTRGSRSHLGWRPGSSRTCGPSCRRSRTRGGLDSFRLVKVGWLLVHVLSVSSLKGGVGKTTVTLGLASAAFARGVSTLVVDLDPQSDVSTGMDINVAGHLNIADVLASPKEKIVRAAIAPSGWTRGRS